MPPAFTASTLALYWTGIAHTCFCAIENYLLRFSSRCKWKNLPLGANIMVLLRVILKEIGWIILGALAKIRGREIGFDPAFFQTNNIGHGAMPGIAHSQLWLDPPSKTRTQSTKSRMGVLSMIEAGVTKALKM